MFEDYFNTDLKQIGICIGSILLTAIVTTGIYWAIFGFDTWTNNMQRAQDLMLAAATQNQTACPTMQMPATPVALGSISGQYICPQHGAVGLPNFDVNGVPHCPLCGMVMTFAATPNSIPQATIMPSHPAVQQIAFGGGGGGGG